MKTLSFALLALSLAGCATAPHAHPSAASHPSGTVIESYRQTPIAQPKESFTWPVRGEVIADFGSKIGYTKNKGIDIQASPGSAVKAANSGQVVFKDDLFRGYGRTVIIDHGNNYQTVYAYNSEILVNVGDIVNKNDVIAKVGSSGRAKLPSLHFEIRRDGEPQNPRYHLQH